MGTNRHPYFEGMFLRDWMEQGMLEANPDTWQQLGFLMGKIVPVFLPTLPQRQLHEVRITGTFYDADAAQYPVYGLSVIGGLLLVRRDATGWIVSVDADDELAEAFFMPYFYHKIVPPADCVGFPADRVYGRPQEGCKQFTVRLPDDIEFYAFCHRLADALVYTN